ncbi:hypothetical protein [Streptomyces scabiei]|nr:hypothetical protein [Streptomyces scabiei]
MDRRTRQVCVAAVPLPMTPKEFELLALPTEEPGELYSRQTNLNTA